MASALTFLMRYHTDGDAFLDQIVTGDETWVSHNTPETKRQSRQRHHPSSPKKPRKFKQTLSTQKVMATVFWDRKGVLSLDFMPKGTTINANRYCETLRKLRRAIQNKRRGMLSRGAVLLHDNARPHTAASTRELLDQFCWEIFDHPPYSPDLAPSDFHLFTKLKDFLGGTRFGSDEELKKTVNTWLNELVAEEYNTGILKLVNRYDKCLNVGDKAVFYGTSAMMYYQFLQLARQWPELATQWEALEHSQKHYGYPCKLKHKIKVITSLVLVGALVEHCLSHHNILRWAALCSSSIRGLFRRYFTNVHKQMFAVVHYNIPLAAVNSILNIIATFTWNFTDLFIMLISMALAERFRLLNQHLDSTRGKVLPESYWHRRREEYNSLSTLTKKVDFCVSKIVLVSFTSNLYFICRQLLSSITPLGNIYERTYFYWSFGFVLFRTLMVSLTASRIFEESQHPREALFAVPSESYSKECERPKTTFTKLEQRSWIKIEVTRGRSAQECFQGLREACADAALPYRTVAQWVKVFREGRDAVQDNLHTGRLCVENNTVQFLASLLDADSNGRFWNIHRTHPICDYDLFTKEPLQGTRYRPDMNLSVL
ncbi:hypothetical protein ANN_25268 [Periplaneta americana]|uniref:Gustatory receptor n=1 Tax=Periplaneta americana TaxID=6978 RepID=A0ABQ8S1H4_PERAM|nr:hypothetical protein ANN_25268 [Periplaneta americana]